MTRLRRGAGRALSVISIGRLQPGHARPSHGHRRSVHRHTRWPISAIRTRKPARRTTAATGSAPGWWPERPTVLISGRAWTAAIRPGAMEGRLTDPAVAALLKGIAQRPFPGLCVVSSRQPLTDLDSFHGKTVDQWPLEHLSDEAGARPVHRTGANRAGAAAIEPDDENCVRPAAKSRPCADAAFDGALPLPCTRRRHSKTRSLGIL